MPIFERNKVSDTKNEYNFFIRNKVMNIISINYIFKKQ